METIELRTAALTDIPKLWDMALSMGVAKVNDYFEKSFEMHEKGQRLIFIASVGDADVGYCMLNWTPRYVLFLKMDIPEIQDLNVLTDYRRRGVANCMIDHCEDLARKAGKEYMGIGVGMDSSYGAAQQLYVRRGYIPDGNGLTYDRQTIQRGAFHPIDDDISLMLIKDLQN